MKFKVSEDNNVSTVFLNGEIDMDIDLDIDTDIFTGPLALGMLDNSIRVSLL